MMKLIITIAVLCVFLLKPSAAIRTYFDLKDELYDTQAKYESCISSVQTFCRIQCEW